jgi:hypothetical protein
MKYNVGDLLRHVRTKNYMLVTGINGERIELYWLSRGYTTTFRLIELPCYFISL